MASENSSRDGNYIPVMMGVTNDVAKEQRMFRMDPSTNRLLVDVGSITISASDGAINDGVSAAIKATVLDYTNSNPLAVRLTDANGDIQTTIGLAAGTNGIGKLTANSGVVIGSVEIAAAQTLATVTTVSTVTNVATIGTSVTPGTAAGNLGKAEDAVHASGDTGVMMLGIRRDTAAASSGTTGDYEPFSTDALGKLWTAQSQVEDAVHASGDRGSFVLGVSNEAQTTLAADGDYIAQATDTKGNGLVVGNIAHDGVDAGAPVKIGAKAISSEPSAVSAGDRTNLLTDLVGKLITLPYANPENFVSGAITSAMTSTTSTSLVAAPAAGLRNYITTIICSNSHATVGTDIIIQDGSGGTTLLTIPAAAVYGGAVITLPTPLRQPTTATALFCANVTTGASTKVSAVGYKGI